MTFGKAFGEHCQRYHASLRSGFKTLVLECLRHSAGGLGTFSVTFGKAFGEHCQRYTRTRYYQGANPGQTQRADWPRLRLVMVRGRCPTFLIQISLICSKFFGQLEVFVLWVSLLCSKSLGGICSKYFGTKRSIGGICSLGLPNLF